MKQQILDSLAALVACDTQNPPREICADSDLFQLIRDQLGTEFRFQVQDFGLGRVNLLATRGDSQRLFNVHLDTVPIGDPEAWTRPPLELTVESERVFGRGVCDIKGAAACLIAAAKSVTADVAILFSTDEEGAESCCIREFCDSDLFAPFHQVVVAEPTGCQAVVGHRGYLSVSMEFTGTAGHTSQFDLLGESANHRAAEWVGQALQRVRDFETGTLNGQSACFNVGRIEGGIKNNMVADHCLVTWSVRLPAGFDNQLLLDLLCHDTPDYLTWKTTFGGAPLPVKMELCELSRQWCQQYDLEVGDDVDFWTEAAIFAHAANSQKPTIVLGPGDIAQAHTVDEWVAMEQLTKVAELYARLMSS